MIRMNVSHDSERCSRGLSNFGRFSHIAVYFHHNMTICCFFVFFMCLIKVDSAEYRQLGITFRIGGEDSDGRFHDLERCSRKFTPNETVFSVIPLFLCYFNATIYLCIHFWTIMKYHMSQFWRSVSVGPCSMWDFDAGWDSAECFP